MHQSDIVYTNLMLCTELQAFEMDLHGAKLTERQNIKLMMENDRYT